MESSRGIPEGEMFLSKPAPDDCADSPTVQPLRIFKPQSPSRVRRPSASSSKPTFPLPPGASSSAAPLPFPDDDDVRKPTPPKPFGSAYAGISPRIDTNQGEKRPGLAERRGASPKVIHSPPSPEADLGLFARPLKEQTRPGSSSANYPSYPKKTNYPPPASGAALPDSVNRFASTASNSTTRATRGSPPPPETPIVEPGTASAGGIEARYAASGIAGTATLNSLQAHQAQSAAAAQRLAQYGHQAPQPQRPWTPTESPGQAPSGPPTVYQGANPVADTPSRPTFDPPPEQPVQTQGDSVPQVSVLEQDYQRVGTKTPPPAYSRVNPNGDYSKEKQRPQQQPARPDTAPAGPSSSPPRKPASSASATSLASPALQHPGHPAFANDPRPEANGQSVQVASTPSLQAPTPASPPPLPEGWIAHLDQNSGQYYYIHLATQATQWEFPKGPNPIQHEQTPLSPTASTYGNPLTSPMFGKQSMASPMFSPHTPGYAESIMSVAASQTPSAAGFSGPPPSSGVDMYRIQPTNGVYFGPYLRYINMDVEKGMWYEVELQMGEGGTERWTYAVTSHLGCTRYEFVVAGRHETGWRFIAHSGNDFAAGTSQNERARLGGVGFMWKDVLQKNIDCGGFHVQLGLGDQIYGDRLWKEVPLLRQWLAMSGRDNKKNVQWTARHEEDVSHAYFHFYTSHFDQPFLREAFAQIPHVLQINDHDIFDGYGSYPAYMQASPMFKNIGRIATDMYLLFQHHTTVEMMRNVSTDHDIFTVTGVGWHFVKHLGPAMAVVGSDCRSERTQARVMAGPTYQGIFPKVATLPPSVQHVIWMVSVPLVYPRLEGVESLANTVAAGKKAVNTTYNILGKVTSSMAGVVGGKEVVAQGFSHVKKAVGKTGLMGNVLNQFGELDIQEVLKDMWTHETKDLERTYFIRTLQGISQRKGIRMTFLSGDVNASGAGLVHDPTHPGDHKTMYQIISSPIVGAPQGGYVLKLLHNQKTLYVPQNGHKSTHEVSDTKEDMMEIFHTDASGASREMKRLMGRRNYVAFVAFDQDAANQTPFSPNPSLAGHQQQQQGLSKLSLAVDFIVQGDGAFQATTKYGPVIVPHLDFGR
ncbi:WW domain-containing protein [Hirsutella rhossiliensis]|uniref:WW domain-containing protein n=1 Tax=Hirsutella rhossiliensis TaxID=111463 RepID=A0A9P8MXW1_9HYPO|nr:WW domain-containing protein [Hirsutella rhossiliensis]KAH0963204.1 WW domain-containing protein [Hirsutella rhossiliensis]